MTKQEINVCQKKAKQQLNDTVKSMQRALTMARENTYHGCSMTYLTALLELSTQLKNETAKKQTRIFFMKIYFFNNKTYLATASASSCVNVGCGAIGTSPHTPAPPTIIL